MVFGDNEDKLSAVVLSIKNVDIPERFDGYNVLGNVKESETQTKENKTELSTSTREICVALIKDNPNDEEEQGEYTEKHYERGITNCYPPWVLGCALYGKEVERWDTIDSELIDELEFVVSDTIPDEGGKVDEGTIISLLGLLYKVDDKATLQENKEVFLDV